MTAVTREPPRQNPTVSFVVPCYKLAHLLADCLKSILSQSYKDFEILVMDDCSPDSTGDVARSFSDPRITYVRNERNLKQIRNYNKGIAASRGKYVWLISADDFLHSPWVLDRYVNAMEENPNIGYVCCPGVAVRDRTESQVIEESRISDRDRTFSGHSFIQKLLSGYIVLAPSALVRRECYDRLGAFPVDVIWADIPIDMAWGGDWYLWLLFALHYDVGYFAEPMVCKREHVLSMTNAITQDSTEQCWASELAVLCMIREKAKEISAWSVARQCLSSIGSNYARHLMSKEYVWMERSSMSSISTAELEQTLHKSTANNRERQWVRARVSQGIGDELYARGDYKGAKRAYLDTLRLDPRIGRAYLKLALLHFGRPGQRARQMLKAIHRQHFN